MGKPAKRTKSKSKDGLDDTPRRFKRLMEMQQKMTQPRAAKTEKRTPRNSKAASTQQQQQQQQQQQPAAPKLERKRGESMAEFSRRVDHSIPLPRAKGVESRKTLRNSKKHKTKAENLRSEYKQRWEAKKREMEERDLENDDLTVEDDGEDIWARVNAKAKQPKFGEVADRPPELPKIQTKSSIPKTAGSLARRQMLEEERQRFIEEYRKMRGAEVQVEDKN